jgi:hypothetical protein
VQIADRYAPLKISNGAENLVLQALQFLKIDVCRKFSGGENISHYWSDQCLMEDNINISV